MYLGIDASLSCTGLIVLGKEGEFKKFAYPSKWSKKFPPGDERLCYYRDVLCAVVMKYKIKYAAIEDYAFGKAKASMAFNLGELGGVIKEVLERCGIQKIRAMPSQLKLWAGRKTPTDIFQGKGRCRCGGKLILPKSAPQSILRKQIPSEKELDKYWKCKDCGKSYSNKDDVIRYAIGNIGEPWLPFRFDGITARAKKEPAKAAAKVVSDLADAYVMAEIAYYFFNKKARKGKDKEQLAILGLLEAR